MAASGGRVRQVDCNIRRRRLRFRNATRQRFFNVNNIIYYSGIITWNDFIDFSVRDISIILAGLSVMVQGGEVFGELDTVSGRLLLQLVRYVADILLVLGMFRTITQPPSALVRDNLGLV